MKHTLETRLELVRLPWYARKRRKSLQRLQSDLKSLEGSDHRTLLCLMKVIDKACSYGFITFTEKAHFTDLIIKQMDEAHALNENG